jgi:hypothetical protein
VYKYSSRFFEQKNWYSISFQKKKKNNKLSMKNIEQINYKIIRYQLLGDLFLFIISTLHPRGPLAQSIAWGTVAVPHSLISDGWSLVSDVEDGGRTAMLFVYGLLAGILEYTILIYDAYLQITILAIY